MIEGGAVAFSDDAFPLENTGLMRRVMDYACMFGKPLILSEFGADTLAGFHAQPPEMFSEEYQAELLVRYIELLRQKPYVVGEHVWNLCDFKTAQGVTRAGALNYKGVFTRDRRPKLAAHRLRALWNK